MKHAQLIILVIFLLFSALAGAQDTIVFRSGDKVIGKVMKVTEHEVEYKRTDNADGPVYNADFSKVGMVVYQNGNRDIFTAPSATITTHTT